MRITGIKIRKTFPLGNVKALISITLDDCIAVHDIKIMQGTKRIYVSMPRRRYSDGTLHDIVHPIKPATRMTLENEVLTAYTDYVLKDV